MDFMVIMPPDGSLQRTVSQVPDPLTLSHRLKSLEDLGNVFAMFGKALGLNHNLCRPERNSEGTPGATHAENPEIRRGFISSVEHPTCAFYCVFANL